MVGWVGGRDMIRIIPLCGSNFQDRTCKIISHTALYLILCTHIQIQYYIWYCVHTYSVIFDTVYAHTLLYLTLCTHILCYIWYCVHKYFVIYDSVYCVYTYTVLCLILCAHMTYSVIFDSVHTHIFHFVYIHTHIWYCVHKYCLIFYIVCTYYIYNVIFDSLYMHTVLYLILCTHIQCYIWYCVLKYTYSVITGIRVAHVQLCECCIHSTQLTHFFPQKCVRLAV